MAKAWDMCLIDHNPRGGEKKPFAPHEARRYNERTQAERANGRLKDEFGGRFVRVQGSGESYGPLDARRIGSLSRPVDEVNDVNSCAFGGQSVPPTVAEPCCHPNLAKNAKKGSYMQIFENRLFRLIDVKEQNCLALLYCEFCKRLFSY